MKEIKEKHADQMVKFQEWESSKKWKLFDYSHYDWWTFPITRESRQFGNRYSLSLEEVECLKNDSIFMRSYRQGVTLVGKSWGFDLENGHRLAQRELSQYWTGHNVRLQKMKESLHLFGEKKLLENVEKFEQQPDVKNNIYSCDMPVD